MPATFHGGKLFIIFVSGKAPGGLQNKIVPDNSFQGFKRTSYFVEICFPEA